MDISIYKRMYITMYTYKIKIENNKYIIRIKMPFAHLLLYSYALCRWFFIIFINKGKYSFKFDDLFIILILLFLIFLSIIARKKTIEVIKIFLKIMRENN
jgi:hypothetical protein